MDHTATRTAYAATGFFSKIILDYLKEAQQLRPFYQHPVSVDGIKAAIEERKKYPTDRKLLVEELQKQYQGVNAPGKLMDNIKSLLSENTFTICTAHQPNIFTGHLYFIYKILHAVKLAEFLKATIPGCDFVPVFYMGSEDADLEELGHIYLNGTRHEWNTKQKGAVGRMKVDKELVKMLDNIGGELGVLPFGKEIIGLMKDCYVDGVTIEAATFKMIDKLFGAYGLVVLLPDNPSLKKAFVPIAERELTDAFSYKAVQETSALFPKEYKVQASGRELNLFYLKDDMRERIEKTDGQYSVLNTPFSFDKPGILHELKEHPERVSANVILRPVFQEMILPDIAFIGGGGEIAYWLELKKVFEKVNMPFPVLVLRNSFMIVDKGHASLMNKLGLTIEDLFRPQDELLVDLVKRDSKVQLNLEKEKKTLLEFYAKLKNTAAVVDKTLEKHTEALHKLALHKIEALEKKMMRAEKKKFEAQQRQLQKLRAGLFPHDGLQERIENLMPFYAKWGKDFIKAIYEDSLSLEQEFVIVKKN